MRFLRSVRFCCGGLDLTRAAFGSPGSPASNSKKHELLDKVRMFDRVPFDTYLFHQNPLVLEWL